jgi:hypothetical protein
MTREQAIALAEAKGYRAKPCAAEDKMAVKIGKADDPNERMRLTPDGQVLVVDEGYYWQVGSVDEWAAYLNKGAT